MSKLNSTIASLLSKMSDRLNRLWAETASQGDRIDEVKAENDKREEAQTLRDQNNVQSLVNLRDSTITGFDKVRADVESLLRQLQRLNERTGQVESQNLILAKSKSDVCAAWPHMVGVEKRVTDIEHQVAHLKVLGYPKPESALPQGHVWVNKKLTGVYETTDELEARVAALETPKSEKVESTNRRIVVEDGQTIVVLAKAPMTVYDPADQYPYTAQAFRVIAERNGPTLVLAPISSPTRINEQMAKDLK